MDAAAPPPLPTPSEYSANIQTGAGQEAVIASMMQNMKVPGASKTKAGNGEAPDEER